MLQQEKLRLQLQKQSDKGPRRRLKTTNKTCFDVVLPLISSIFLLNKNCVKTMMSQGYPVTK